jgi:serine/threonine protein kinase
MSDQFVGKVLAGKYQVGDCFSESDLGKIYHGTHLLMEKPVTIKILSPALAVDAEIVRQFSSEAKTASRVTHPNILNVTDFNADQNGTVYIVMEAAEGDTLKNILQREGAFSPERAFSAARQTAAALSAAHAAGIVHKSLNPDNILFGRDLRSRETVKIMNFGAFTTDYAQNEDEENFHPNLKYTAPEQDSGISEPDERTDIYSLGVIFYEMLAGETPFNGVNQTDLMFKKSEELPAPLSAFRADLPEGVEAVILKALAKNPAMRQRSAAEFVEELNRATDYSAEQETIVLARAAETDAAQNNLWKTAFIVLVGVCSLAGFFIYATSVKQTDPQTQMQFDANGQPVQPINPATGMNEQGASNMLPFSANMAQDANMMMPQTLPGGDGYDPWGAGTAPPPGAPMPVYPSGETYTIPGNSGSVFMPQEGVILVPVPVNTNANTQTAPPKTPPANQANTQVAPSPKPSPTKPPAAKPSPAKPSPSPPASTEKKIESGKQQDS